jgi:O-acetyl-ADP-ribose deacetylase (regulator of RNase III)
MTTLNTKTTIGNVTLELRQGNIALQHVDAVVNAANEFLSFGSGVAGAIIAAGGDLIQKECNEIGRCQTGSAVITTGGNLPAKYVIHAVGPMYGEGKEDEKLRSAINASLTLAEEKGIRSIAFPALSAGYFHFPIVKCANVIVNAIKDAAPSLKSVDYVVICVSDVEKLGVFANTLNS